MKTLQQATMFLDDAFTESDFLHKKFRHKTILNEWQDLKIKLTAIDEKQLVEISQNSFQQHALQECYI